MSPGGEPAEERSLVSSNPAPPQLRPTDTQHAPLIGGHSVSVGDSDVPFRRPTGSDAITVLGDTRQLSRTGQRPQDFPERAAGAPFPAKIGPDSSNHDPLVAGVGAGFPGERGPIDDSSLISLKDWIKILEKRVRNAIKRSQWQESSPNSKFLSFRDLDEIINRSFVGSVVQHLSGCTDVERTTRSVWDPIVIASPPSTRTHQGTEITTRRRLFLLLLLADKADKILELIDQGVYDQDLPFTWEEMDECPRGRASEHSTGLLVTCLSEESIGTRTVFCNWQWRTLAPFLCLSTREDPRVSHYTPDVQAPLPFIEATTTFAVPERQRGNKGGFSVVRRVSIEPSHFNSDSFKAPPGERHPFFAVKTLDRFTEQAAFMREAEALKRMMTQEELHRSLVRLLATIKHGDRYHMIFPWAEASLHEFWNDMFPELTDLPRGPSLLQWMAWELMGLAEAIRLVHNSTVPPSNPQDLEATPKVYGCHGDVKPQNILFFQDHERSSAPGNLQLADFGFARFHSKDSVRVSVGSTVGMTETYRSPEFDLDPQLFSGRRSGIGPKSDIWSFGAVVLEFIAWYCDGWTGVESFTDQRTDDDLTPDIAQDKFFNNYPGYGHRVKKSVTNYINTLRAHPRSCEYLEDLLDYTESSLLVVDEGARASCYDVCKKFKEMHQKCEEESYCTKRAKASVLGDPLTSEPASNEAVLPKDEVASGTSNPADRPAHHMDRESVGSASDTDDETDERHGSMFSLTTKNESNSTDLTQMSSQSQIPRGDGELSRKRKLPEELAIDRVPKATRASTG